MHNARSRQLERKTGSGKKTVHVGDKRQQSFIAIEGQMVMLEEIVPLALMWLANMARNELKKVQNRQCRGDNLG
jgi:hypothetical protein